MHEMMARQIIGHLFAVSLYSFCPRQFIWFLFHFLIPIHCDFLQAQLKAFSSFSCKSLAQTAHSWGSRSQSLVSRDSFQNSSLIPAPTKQFSVCFSCCVSMLSNVSRFPSMSMLTSHATQQCFTLSLTGVAEVPVFQLTGLLVAKMGAPRLMQASA